MVGSNHWVTNTDNINLFSVLRKNRPATISGGWPFSMNYLLWICYHKENLKAFFTVSSNVLLSCCIYWLLGYRFHISGAIFHLLIHFPRLYISDMKPTLRPKCRFRLWTHHRHNLHLTSAHLTNFMTLEIFDSGTEDTILSTPKFITLADETYNSNSCKTQWINICNKH